MVKGQAAVSISEKKVRMKARMSGDDEAGGAWNCACGQGDLAQTEACLTAPPTTD